MDILDFRKEQSGFSAKNANKKNYLGFQVRHVDAQSKNAKNSKNSRLKGELRKFPKVSSTQWWCESGGKNGSFDYSLKMKTSPRPQISKCATLMRASKKLKIIN